jgi:PPOX class probable F420-dependent enzyme
VVLLGRILPSTSNDHERELDEETRKFISGHRVARLATADAEGRPTVIPICYAFDGEVIYSVLDEKKKSVADRDLKRVRNIEANPHVSLLVDDYFEDWSRLTYVLVSGAGEMMEPDAEHAREHARAVTLLREKYSQYRSMAIDRRPILKITPVRIRRWLAGS